MREWKIMTCQGIWSWTPGLSFSRRELKRTIPWSLVHSIIMTNLQFYHLYFSQNSTHSCNNSWNCIDHHDMLFDVKWQHVWTLAVVYTRQVLQQTLSTVLSRCQENATNPSKSHLTCKSQIDNTNDNIKSFKVLIRQKKVHVYVIDVSAWSRYKRADKE